MQSSEAGLSEQISDGWAPQPAAILLSKQLCVTWCSPASSAAEASVVLNFASIQRK